MKIRINQCTCPYKMYKHLVGKIFEVSFSFTNIERYAILSDTLDQYYIHFPDAEIVDKKIIHSEL